MSFVWASGSHLYGRMQNHDSATVLASMNRTVLENSAIWGERAAAVGGCPGIGIGNQYFET